jgi:hypothetical protein
VGPLDRGWRRCICVASGPSLTDDQVALVHQGHAEGWKVLVTNSTFRRFPGADVMFASDNTYWNKYAPSIAADFRGERWTPDSRAAKKYGAHHVRLLYELDRRSGLKAGLARHGKYLRHNGNTGAHTVSLAYCFGMRVGILVGYDMQLTGGTPNGDGDLEGGPVHHHGPHPTGLGNPTAHAFRQWRARFDVLARDLKECGVHLVNASLQTALTSVARMDLWEALDLKA